MAQIVSPSHHADHCSFMPYVHDYVSKTNICVQNLFRISLKVSGFLVYI